MKVWKRMLFLLVFTVLGTGIWAVNAGAAVVSTGTARTKTGGTITYEVSTYYDAYGEGPYRRMILNGAGEMMDYKPFVDCPGDIAAPWQDDQQAMWAATVEVRGGITHIGNCAFSYMYNLNKVIFSEGVTSIGEDLFHACSYVKEVSIPNSVTSISPNAFSSTLQDVRILCNSDSYAKTYAQQHKIKYTLLDAAPTPTPAPVHKHTGVTTITKATTSRNGSITEKCSSCGQTLSQKVIYYPKTVTLSKTSYTYTGKAVKPSVSVKDAGGKTIGSANYTVTYAGGRKNAGTYQVKVTFKGNYSGSVTKTFTIKKAAQTISASNQTRTLGSKAFSLKAKLTKGNGKLTYRSSNTKVAAVSKTGGITVRGVGRSTITITAAATSNYNRAVKKITVTVRPKGTTLTAVKNSSAKKMTIQWKRNRTVTGYQIRYAANSSFKSAKTAVVKKNTTLKTTISKLTKGKTYYVQIRTYQKVGGKNYYSTWSGTKKIKIAK